MIAHNHADMIAFGFSRKLHAVAAAMADGVINQVDEHLHNEHFIHGNHGNFIGHAHGKINVGKAFARFGGNLRKDFIQRFADFFERERAACDAGDRKHVFDHAKQPFGILMDAGDQAAAAFGVDQVAVVEQGAGRAKNAGQRRTQVMGDCAQQIAAHFFFFGFDQNLLAFFGQARAFPGKFALLFDVAAERARGHGNGQHDKKGYRIPLNGEIQVKQRVCKKEIDA